MGKMENKAKELIKILKKNTADLEAIAKSFDTINRCLSGSCDVASYSVIPFGVDFSSQATILKDIKGRVSIT